MKNHGFSIASALIGIVLALIGLNSEKAFAQIPEDALKSIPRACQYIAVIDAQRLVASNLYVRSLQEPQLIGKMRDNLVDFAKITGAVPERDISSLLVAGSRQSDLYGDFIIAAGRFDKNEIKRRVLSSTHSAERHYRGAEILPAEVQNGIILKAAVFLSDQEIALGSLRFLQEVLDAKAAAKKISFRIP